MSESIFSCMQKSQSALHFFNQQSDVKISKENIKGLFSSVINKSMVTQDTEVNLQGDQANLIKGLIRCLFNPKHLDELNIEPELKREVKGSIDKLRILRHGSMFSPVYTRSLVEVAMILYIKLAIDKYENDSHQLSQLFNSFHSNEFYKKAKADLLEIICPEQNNSQDRAADKNKKDDDAKFRRDVQKSIDKYITRKTIVCNYPYVSVNHHVLNLGAANINTLNAIRKPVKNQQLRTMYTSSGLAKEKLEAKDYFSNLRERINNIDKAQEENLLQKNTDSLTKQDKTALEDIINKRNELFIMHITIKKIFNMYQRNLCEGSLSVYAMLEICKPFFNALGLNDYKDQLDYIHYTSIQVTHTNNGLWLKRLTLAPALCALRLGGAVASLFMSIFGIVYGVIVKNALAVTGNTGAVAGFAQNYSAVNYFWRGTQPNYGDGVKSSTKGAKDEIHEITGLHRSVTMDGNIIDLHGKASLGDKGHPLLDGAISSKKLWGFVKTAGKDIKENSLIDMLKKIVEVSRKFGAVYRANPLSDWLELEGDTNELENDETLTQQNLSQVPLSRPQLREDKGTQILHNGTSLDNLLLGDHQSLQTLQTVPQTCRQAQSLFDLSTAYRSRLMPRRGPSTLTSLGEEAEGGSFDNEPRDRISAQQCASRRSLSNQAVTQQLTQQGAFGGLAANMLTESPGSARF